MAGEIFIADKQTLDITKTNTDSIKQDIDYIKQQFPISGGTNWADYHRVCKRVDVDLDKLQKEYTTVFEINGEGYIDDLVLLHYANNGYSVYANVTLDGTVIYDGTISSYPSICYCGFYNMQDKQFIEHATKHVTKSGNYPDLWTEPLPIVPPTLQGDYYISSTSSSTAFFNITKSIFFKKSLIIKMKYYKYRQNKPCILFLGGVK